MKNAQPRVLGLVAIASWLLLDSLRMAGPLLSSLYENSLTSVALATFATFAGGGVLAWLAAMMGRHFGHGVVVLYLLAVLAILRLGLPSIAGGWLIAAGLYLTAIAIAGVVMTARVALGNGGPGYLLAGTTLGVAAAVAEQAVLRTWDAVWRADALGWAAMGLVVVLAVFNGWRCRDLEPAPSSQGWWAFGFYWSLLIIAFGNVAWINAQSGLRMSASVIVTIMSLCVAAGLAAQAHRISRPVAMTIAVLGAIGLGLLIQREGTDAIVALPVAIAATTLATAQSLGPAKSPALRRLLAAVVFGLAIITPVLLVQIDSELPLGFPHLAVMFATGIALLAYGAFRAWSAGPLAPADSGVAWIGPGVLLRVRVGAGIALVIGVWTYATYETEPVYSADFVPAPHVVSWNTHQGITHESGAGPRIDLDEIAATVRGNDVIALQEVNRGTLLGGGTDMLEYLAGELRLPYAYSSAYDRQYGNAIFTSRPHANARDVELTQDDGPERRSAIAVDFMGSTFASAQLQSTDNANMTYVIQVEELIAWLDGPQPIVVGADFGREPGSASHTAMLDAGFVDAQAALGVEGPTYIGPDLTGERAATLDYVFGRNVEFTQFELVPVPWSDHWPLVVRVSTGATAPTDLNADFNDLQRVPSISPSPSPSSSPGASASPSPAPSPSN